ncbi:hypothetical protein SS27_05245 [Enterobacter kobei]|nr:hypothetical protein SS27_05245 [Enterobacter kobei]
MSDKSRGNNVAHDGFMGNKSGATINILALAVAFFCVIRHPKATTSMCSMSAFRTIHHIRLSPPIPRNHIMIHHESIL